MLIIQQGTLIAIQVFILVVVLFNTLVPSGVPLQALLVDRQQ